jgi:putative endonuclease
MTGRSDLWSALREWLGSVCGFGVRQDRGERDPLGPAGERLAARHLRKSGYRVLGRNLRVPMGEADILALAPDERTVVLVEVKSRRVAPIVAGTQSVGTSATAGFVAPPPEASITAHKRAKLVSIMRHLARANGWTDRPVRIDAIAVEWPPEGEATVRHHVDAVRARG